MLISFNHTRAGFGGDDVVMAMSGRLSSALFQVKDCVMSVVTTLSCVLSSMFLCHAVAHIARHYAVTRGHVDRVPIYQCGDDNYAIPADRAEGGRSAMQMTASWLESCDRGVYVGESAYDANRAT